MEIELPDGTVLDAPDDADPSVVAKAYLAKQKAPAAPAKRSGIFDYLAGPMEASAKLGSSMLTAPIAGFAGMGAAGLQAMGMDVDPTSVIDKVNSFAYQPSDAGKATSHFIETPLRYVQQAGDVSGDQANAQGSQKMRISATAANYGVEPMQASDNRSQGERALEGAAVNTAVQSLPSLLLRGKAGGVAGDVSRPSVLGRNVDGAPGAPRVPAAASERPGGLATVSEAAPTKEALKSAATAAYKRADEIGATIQPEVFERFKQSTLSDLKKDGLNDKLHPDATAALEEITKTEGPVTIQQLDTLRKIARDAEGSIKPPDKRMAGEIIDRIDDFADSLTAKELSSGSTEAAAALKDARSYWSRAKKADELDELIRRAELSAPNFSASGMENAVRTEFRALAKNQRRMRLFNGEERAAIEKVVKGGPMDNVLRMIGKAAPTGVVSAALGSGIGFALGGPAGAAAVPAIGAGSRFLASRGTMANAAKANELVRRGPMPATIEAAQRSGILTPEQAKFLNQ